MPKFIDVHSGMKGVSREDLERAHAKDLEVESEEGVHFEKWFADTERGAVFCLSEGPDEAAVRRVHERAGHPPDEVYKITESGE